MKAAVRRFFAETSREVLRMIKAEMGTHAMVLSNRKVSGGVEMLVMEPHDIAHIVSPSPGSPATQATDDADADFHVALSAAARRNLASDIQADDVPMNTVPAPEKQRSSSGHAEMMEKLDRIHRLLEHRLDDPAVEHAKTPDPERTQLFASLLEAGFSAALARKLIEVAKIPATSGAGCSLQQAVMGILRRSIKVLPHEDEFLCLGGVHVLVGPTGVGKTTTVAKLAARFVTRYGPSQVALLTTDCYRVGAYQQLATYGHILGVPVHAVQDAAQLRGALAELAGRPIILVDTVGMGQRDQAVAAQNALLAEAGEPINRFLLLNAAVRTEVLEEVLHVYGHSGLTGCIITKTDEADSLAPVVDLSIRHLLKIFYVTTGQRVPEDLHFPDADFLLERVFKTATQSHFRFNEEEAGLMLGRSHVQQGDWVLGGLDVANRDQDQAAGLRRLFGHASHPVATFFAVSPEDASHAALCCMTSLADRGESVLLIDAVGRQGSVCDLLCHPPMRDLSDVVAQRVPMDDVLIVPQKNALILPASMALRELPSSSVSYRRRVASLIHQAEKNAAVTIVLADANDPNSPFLCESAQAVACMPATPSGLRSGYHLIKKFRARRSSSSLMLVTTQSPGTQNGHRTVEEFCNVAQRTLDVTMLWVASLSVGGNAWFPEMLNARDRENSVRLADAVLFQSHAMAD